MIIKLTHAKDFIEYPLNVDEQNAQAERLEDGQNPNNASMLKQGNEMGKR